jgi:nucleotide-binding universal stress UspA family protein
MKTLIAIDDSKFSEEALRFAASHIPPQGSEVRVLHVLQPIAFSAPPQMAQQYAPELESQGKQARELVERFAATLRAKNFKVEAEVEKGDIRLKIIDSAREWNADLVIVGSHGRTGIPRVLLGSVAEFVARNAPCSVLIVRSTARS